ncbi:L,D-transpeptidase family protein [bacterium]|nr:L,D-transpeptidase family protein [bacterium]
MPPKTVVPTAFCSQMELIDRAERVLFPESSIKADRVVISKARKFIYLLNKERVLVEYPVSFGFGFADGAKAQSGDGRTPEGLYSIDLKNSKSNYYKALRISYPNAQDTKFASGYAANAGGDIMIHGFPTKAIDGLNPAQVPLDHLTLDWTRGCVAVTNAEIDFIFDAVNLKTPVEICPL